MERRGLSDFEVRQQLRELNVPVFRQPQEEEIDFDGVKLEEIMSGIMTRLKKIIRYDSPAVYDGPMAEVIDMAAARERLRGTPETQARQR